MICAICGSDSLGAWLRDDGVIRCACCEFDTYALLDYGEDNHADIEGEE